MSIADFYNSTAVVSQMIRQKTGMGSTSRSYATRIPSLACRLAMKTIAEVDQNDKATMREVWRLYCAATSTNKAIETTDRIVVNSKTFEVTGIYNPGNLDKHLQIDLLEVN